MLHRREPALAPREDMRRPRPQPGPVACVLDIAQPTNCTRLGGTDRYSPTPAMSNVEVNRVLGRDGKIRLHGPEAFAGMRVAGRLAAAALDMLVPHVRPGVTTEDLDDLVLEFALDHGAIPAPSTTAGSRRRSAPRSTTSSATASPAQAAARGRHRQHRRHAHRRRLARGQQPHVPGRHHPRRAERLIEVTYRALQRGIAA